MARAQRDASGGAQPSAEAIEAAHRASTNAMFNFTYHGLEDDHLRCEQRKAHAALTAAYAIDAPAIHAAGVEEGRAAMLREVVEWLRDRTGWSARAWHERRDVADAIEARFPAAPKAERPLPCWKTLVGRGGDTWDPVCGLVHGHEGPCSANPRDWPEWSDSDWAEARFPSEGTT